MPLPGMRRALSIRFRLALVYGALLLVTLVGFDLLLYWTLLGNLSREFDDSLRVRAAEVAHALHAGKGGRLDADDIKRGMLEPASLENLAEPGVYVQVFDAAGLAIANSGTQLPVDAALLTLALQGAETVGSVPVGDETIRALLLPVSGGGKTIGAVQVSQSSRFLDATLTEVRTLLALGSLVALVAATLAGWLLLGRALQPVGRVTAIARRIIATGRLETRIANPGPPDEIGELARAFNLMIERLEVAFLQQRQLLADTSHELRNPLTVIQGNLDILQHDIDPDEREDVVRECKQQAAHLSRLVSDLLLLARGDAGQELGRYPVALADLVHQVHQRGVVLGGGRTVILERCDPIEVMGDADRLQQLFWNLVENALRYTPETGEVLLCLEQIDGWAQFSVHDNGPGIAVEHQERIFERFYRVDKARSRRTGGTGLGLAIARYLAEAHGGSIAVESQPGEGSTFTVRLAAVRYTPTANGPRSPVKLPVRSTVSDAAGRLRR